MNHSAQNFVKTWLNRGDEKSDTQSFWTSLLRDVYGIEHPESFIQFEQRVKLKNVSFIDASIPTTHVLIEQKSADVDLMKPIRQSDGSLLTPYEQARRYNSRLPHSENCKWIIVCNFREFHVYDMDQLDAKPTVLKLEDLPEQLQLLKFMVDETQNETYKKTKLSIEAGILVGKLYDALLAQYRDPNSPETLRSLNILCVRLVFCFYAEHVGILGKPDCVREYLSRNQTNLRDALIKLFRILDQKPEERDPYADEDLLAFPYVNGGLFAEQNVEIPRLTPEIAELMTRDCSRDFDWSKISPTIFGAVFESTLNPETRRSGGMHYTSIENIHRVIDPLFLEDLRAELKEIFAVSVEKTREKRLKDFQTRLASLTFFDPACGSGNFLTETYVSIRRLENDVLRALAKGQMFLSDVSPVQVSISQFYGIEINDFAVSVARTALWIAESQMLQETEGIINRPLDFLPLHTHAHITEGNALRLDWETVVPKERLDFIMGNPPFVGYSLQTSEQKEDVLAIYVDEKGKPYKTAGKIDYVSAWYFKAAQLIHGTGIRVAFVSTNSITQGEQVASVWKPLFQRFGIQIDFAWRTFRWDSEAKILAHVHCVIVGFSSCNPLPNENPYGVSASRPDGILPNENPYGVSASRPDGILPNENPYGVSASRPAGILPNENPYGVSKSPFLFNENGDKIPAKTINPYLIDAPMVFIESRSKPICDVPEMVYGNKPTDGGFFFLTEEEKNELLKVEPLAEKYIRRVYGADEFINNKKRFCLWLVAANPAELRKLPTVMQRISNVREFRLNSPKKATQISAETPTLFQEIRQPENNYILVPRHSSENRRFIPIGFMNSTEICSDANQMIPNATLYHFGVLTSSVHMAWMRAVCGRLEMRYRYSKDIVYNNFPWPVVQEASPFRGGGDEVAGGGAAQFKASPFRGGGDEVAGGVALKRSESSPTPRNPPASLRSAAPLKGGPLKTAPQFKASPFRGGGDEVAGGVALKRSESSPLPPPVSLCEPAPLRGGL